MPYSIKDVLTMWADQFDWSAIRKIKEAIELGLALGLLFDFWALIIIRL